MAHFRNHQEEIAFILKTRALSDEDFALEVQRLEEQCDEEYLDIAIQEVFDEKKKQEKKR